MSVGTAGFSGTIFIDVDVVRFSFIGLAVVPRNPESHIRMWSTHHTTNQPACGFNAAKSRVGAARVSLG